MSEWLDNQKNPNINFRQLLQERIDKSNPRRKLSTDETKRLGKLEVIADKLKRGENVQNRLLKTWLSEHGTNRLSMIGQSNLNFEVNSKINQTT
ncbi:hypothetical protein N9O66_00485 [Alphaproteobacteria bacterium]|nr:hypothetical protein [Alphaproteobacteria bacterium]